MNKVKSLNLIIVVIILISLNACSEKKNKGNQLLTDKLMHKIDSLYVNEADYAPGIIVLIKDKSKNIDFVYTKGVQDIHTLNPVKPDLLFSIASNTKTFSVMALLQLVDEGLISLENSLSEYFPQIANSENIKIKHLANMTSGLPDYTMSFEFMYLLFNNPETSFTFEQILNFIDGQSVYFEAGTQFDYSNTNTVIIQNIVEMITGHSFKHEIDRRFINKLNLKNTYYPEVAGFPTENYLHGYEMISSDEYFDEFSAVFDPSVFGAAGCMISNIYDMEKWVKRLASGLDISNETNDLRKEGKFVIPGVMQYCLGYSDTFGWIGHTGGIPGYSNLVLHNPIHDNTLIVAQSSYLGGVDVWEYFITMLTVLYPEYNFSGDSFKSFYDDSKRQIKDFVK